MKIHLVSGGCGFVGRNVVKRLLKTTEDTIFVVDDLSIGRHPSEWLDGFSSRMEKDLEIIGENGRFLFWKGDLRDFLFSFRNNPNYIQEKYYLDFRTVGEDELDQLAAAINRVADIKGK